MTQSAGSNVYSPRRFAVDYDDASITLSDLRQRWEWDPLRNDPRFQKILAAPEPKTIYK